jgi:hypothetical protein
MVDGRPVTTGEDGLLSHPFRSGAYSKPERGLTWALDLVGRLWPSTFISIYLDFDRVYTVMVDLRLAFPRNTPSCGTDQVH